MLRNLKLKILVPNEGLVYIRAVKRENRDHLMQVCVWDLKYIWWRFGAKRDQHKGLKVHGGYTKVLLFYFFNTKVSWRFRASLKVSCRFHERSPWKRRKYRKMITLSSYLLRSKPIFRLQLPAHGGMDLWFPLFHPLKMFTFRIGLYCSTTLTCSTSTGWCAGGLMSTWK